MAKYQRVKGGEKNEKTGIDWTEKELEEVCYLYVDLDGKNIHENNPKIHVLAEKLDRTVRSVENQLLGFKKVASGDTGRKNYNSLIPKIWFEKRPRPIEPKPKITQIENSTPDDFKFRISSQLKNILGKDLILDDNIALFELVKNSYDAHASNVKLIFDDDSITIIDDGKGMSRQDLLDKWLFVAFSAKVEGDEDRDLKKEEYKDYRNRIADRPTYAGAKGIGRFSTDRLGSKLTLTTKNVLKDSKYEQLYFDWNIFESNPQENFNEINIEHHALDNTDYEGFEHGLILKITDLRNIWTHKDIIDLKWSLEKLINPFEAITDNSQDFKIEIIASKYYKEDEKTENPRFKANGVVGNFIFDTLNIKTTQIKSSISEDGEYITTELIDRGQLIYKIREENPYQYLTNVNCQLYYLNTSAKSNFTRLMGINPTNFGSIFLFNRGFRVYPIGEPDDDPFEINRRKNQGRTRYLGARELIGRIEIKSASENFIETTSREGGLIETPGTKELATFFRSILVRFERYVVDIQWPIKDQSDDLSLLSGVESKRKIIALVNKLVDNDYIELLDYAKDFFDIINEKNVVSTPEIFDQLRNLAEKRGDTTLASEIDLSKEEFIKIKKAKEEEENKRIEAEKLAEVAEERRKEEEQKRKDAELRALKAEEEKKQREGQVKFYQSVQTLDIVEVQNLHHQIIIDAGAIETSIRAFKIKLDKSVNTSKDEINSLLEDITFSYKKILAVAKFTTKENFLSANRSIVGDIVAFLSSYLSTIYKFHTDNKLKITISNPKNVFFETTYKPIELTIIIDNLLSNSKKKNANNVIISFIKSGNVLSISFKDDGDGLDVNIANPDLIFDRGFTTTRGSGIGLFHVKQIMHEEFNGDIAVNNKLSKGLEFILTFNEI